MQVIILMIWLIWPNHVSTPLAEGAMVVASSSPTPAPIFPDKLRTPGAVLTVSAVQVCARGYAKATRNVPERIKMVVLHSYGMTSGQGYEIDHLISLELGGSNNPANLWPESYFGPLNAHVKDRLENKLHELVCQGKISLPEAQREISANWIYYYYFYFPEDLPKYPTPATLQSPDPIHESL